MSSQWKLPQVSETLASNPNSVNTVAGCTPDLEGATTRTKDGGEFLRGHANQQSKPKTKSKEWIKNKIKVAD